MSIVTKLGFSRQERIALTILCGILLLGLFLTGLRQNSLKAENSALTAEDSAAVAQLEKLSSSNSNPAETDASSSQKAQPELNIFPLDINSASAEQLETLSGIGPVLAQKIVDYRNQHGPFAAPDSLINVNGIGKSKLNLIKDKIIVNTPRTEN